MAVGNTSQFFLRVDETLLATSVGKGMEGKVAAGGWLAGAIATVTPVSGVEC